jgi:hypothetical protein
MGDGATNGERLAALSALIADYEAEFGAITDDEMDEQARLDHQLIDASRARIRQLRRSG